MERYFLHLAYNGAAYCGWQIQPKEKTVQETIENALRILLRKEVSIAGAGRTDTGVHARSMYAHFDAEIEDKEQLLYKLNRILPNDIVIYDILSVNHAAHARFDAVSRLYRYYLTTSKDPFLFPFKYKVREGIDLEAMNRCAQVLFDYTDFTSFSKLHTDVKTNNCKIMQAQWEQDGDDYVFTIKADRFLRNMVRAIVGTLIEAGKGKLDVEGMRRIIETKDRGVAGASVPGHALFLEEIEYPADIFS